MVFRYDINTNAFGRTLLGGRGISVANGDGVGGNPTFGAIGNNEAITFGTTVTPDFSFVNHTCTLTGSFTLGNPTNKTNNTRGIIALTQDATGSRVMSAKGTNWLFPGGLPTLSTSANATDLIIYEVANNGLIFAQLLKAFV